ncbi:ABC transporter related protein [Methanocaldococcus infernus ME]|uniref:ABC transporter related protein n=1 Tax=Methanocaldococcus infernus (strain DSM 11812 / JCM 15783 / ME) TaxID=573063 RepID=D5VU06_METIM|nr:ABC transporter ATP-binding protein [Methanocaldococcus infernus]ADG14059.1 ABC transporter related protein [Methanocaldococcus infernus ME]
MLKTENLAVGYNKRIIIDNINLEIKEGEILAIIGPNGVGKSTLLKCIASYLDPIKGVVYLDSNVIHKLKPSQLAKKMAVVLTERVNPGNLTGFDIIAIGRHPYTDLFGRLTEKDKEIIIESARAVNALHLLEKNFFEMSDGERQKIMIARALAQEPKVLILDEPTSFLDAKHKIELTLLLRKLAIEKNLAIVVTIHDIELALRIADKIALIKDGKIIGYGHPEDIMDKETVNNLYDLKSANFNEEIGYFELKNENTIVKKVFVVCGGGSGANVLRYLVKNRYKVYCGVLHENDIDYVIAKTMETVVVSEKPYQPISEEKFNEALKYIKMCDVVIETNFPIGEINKLNLKLIGLTKEYGKKVIKFSGKIKELNKQLLSLF